MKKSKLITTLCTLVLTLACLTFGVYSAVKTSFTASGSITFNAYGINLDIDMSFAGTETAIANKYVSTHTDRSEHLTSGQTYTDISAGVTGLALVFDELTVPEGKTEPELKITMTLNVKNYSGFEIMATPTLKFGASGAESTATFDSTFTSTVTNKVLGLADKATAAITIEISPKGTTAITSNNNFKFEFEFAPFKLTESNYEAYCTSLGYTILSGGIHDDATTTNSLPEGVTKVALPYTSWSSTYDNFSYFDGTDIESLIITPKAYLTNGVFLNCKKLKEIIFVGEYNVTNIGEGAFGSCTALTSVTIPNGVTNIEYDAFGSCTALTNVYIPATMTKIWSSAFSGCSKLTSITFGGTKAQWNAIELCSGDDTYENDWNANTGAYTIHCTDGDIAKS